MKTVIIGTRGSALALVQARSVMAAMTLAHPDRSFELSIIKTTGDRILDAPLSKIGDKGLFTREIEQALIEGVIDCAVHSLKDLPTMLPEGLVLGAVTERLDPRDVFISRNDVAFNELKHGAVVATSSMRRRAQVLSHRPDIDVVDIRGNVNTRLARLESDPSLDGIILAHAGVARLGLLDRVTETLDDRVIIPAVGQAALGIEMRCDDRDMASLISVLHHAPTFQAVSCERRFLSRLEGGCQVPIAGYARVQGDAITLIGLVASTDGILVCRGDHSGPTADFLAVGDALARRLLDEGAKTILESIYGRAME